VSARIDLFQNQRPTTFYANNSVGAISCSVGGSSGGDQTPEHNVRLFAINADLDDDFPALGFWAGERIGSANKTNNANSLRILPTIFA
jgi:hypothetical protein